MRPWARLLVERTQAVTFVMSARCPIRRWREAILGHSALVVSGVDGFLHWPCVQLQGTQAMFR